MASSESPLPALESVTPAHPAPTRSMIVVLLMLIAALSHFNRISISTAGNARIMDEYQISPERMGWVYSAFLFTYTAFMIPGGWIIDRFGARRALLLVLFGSAIFVALTGAVGLAVTSAVIAFPTFLLVRGLMGITTAPLHPSCAQMVASWVPPGARSRANGSVTGAAVTGIAATPLVFGALITWIDWSWAFLLASAGTAALGCAWMALASDRPDRPPAPEASAGFHSAAVPEKSSPRWLDLFWDRSLVLLTISFAAVGYFEYLFFYWMEYYFNKVLILPAERSRLYTTVVVLGMAVGMPLGGWLADRLERAYGVRWGRRLVPMLGMGAGAVLLLLGVLAKGPAWIVLWFTLAMAAVGASESPFWATATELGGRRGGSAAALLNTGGNAGGILAPILTPFVGERYGWGPAVAVGGLVCAVGVLLWLGVHPRPRADQR